MKAVSALKNLTATEAQALHAGLCWLLLDCVASGASVGFLPPLETAQAQAYWDAVIAEVKAGTRILLTALCDGEVNGSVQLALAQQANAKHRAEVQKLMVHTTRRGRGLAQGLMTELETIARKNGRTLLVLDTKQGDRAERLYEKWGYQRAGVIPHYAQSADGALHGTVVFYKAL